MKTGTNRYGFAYPKKRLAQHFLIDRNIIRKIIAAAGVREGEYVIEVGPGRGALTEALLEAGAKVIAIELDPALTGKLSERFGGVKGFELIGEDALKVSYAGLSRDKGLRFKVVSNLPYNISGPIVVKFVEERQAFTALVIMLQKEVARRLAAVPGTKDYGALSVLTQTYCDVRCLFDVQPASFTPRPKVTSTVASLTVLESPRVEVHDERFFKTVVKSAFGHRRKTLQNALKTLGRPAGEIKAVLDALNIEAKRRGETLTLTEFSRLTGALLKRTP